MWILTSVTTCSDWALGLVGWFCFVFKGKRGEGDVREHRCAHSIGLKSSLL